MLLVEEQRLLSDMLAAELGLRDALLGMDASVIDASTAVVERAQHALFAHRERRDQALRQLSGSAARRTAEQVLSLLGASERPELHAALALARAGWHRWSVQRQRNLEHVTQGRHLLKKLAGTADETTTYGARHGRARRGGAA